MQDSLTTIFGLNNQQAVRLRQTYEARCGLFFAQPLPIQQFFISQSRPLAEALLKGTLQVHFQLPDRVVCEAGASTPLPVPENLRRQKARIRVNRFRRNGFQAALCEHLTSLEGSPNQAVSVAASLTRFTTVMVMVQGMLPAYRDEASGFPLVATGDRSIFKEGETEKESDPQQVQGNSTQRSVFILAVAVKFAPYIVADQGYRLQCISTLSDLVKQGQASAVGQMREIIARLKVKAAAHELDRGLSLSLPFFDDRKMEMSLYDFEVIQVGRIPFDPRCVVMATRAERSKVANAVYLSNTTRKHLLAELSMLEEAFL